MSEILFPHNSAAYRKVLTMLEESGKACVIHPTGTGKSFIGFQYAADHPDERILWLAPSQYIFTTQLENWKRACASADAMQAGNRTESGSWRVAGGNDPGNISFLTYAKLSILTPDELAGLRPAVILADEMHRTGASVWGEGFRRLRERFPEARLIGLTATNIRYLDGQRDMAQELFDGQVASEMSLGEAIVRGILPAPKYVLSIFRYKDDLAKYELRARRTKNRATRDAAEEIIEKLRRALENAVGMDQLFAKHMTDRAGKYLVFCANYEHMTEMIQTGKDWFHLVDAHPHVYSAYADDPATSRAFADFKADRSDHLKLLYCIDMLNEGVHVDDVSGVILLRPTVSPIVYKQQIGRALSSSSGKTPVIFDIVLNIENLYSVGSIEEEMEAATVYYRDLGQGEELTDSFEIIDEVHDCLELFDRLNDTLTASWDLMYECARKYWEENGDLDVPKRYVTAEGYSLGPWLDRQRRVCSGKTAGILTPGQIAKLDALGMRWKSVSELSWERYYAAAKAYRDAHGDLLVKIDYVSPDGLALGSWIANLRAQRKAGIRSGYLTEERVAALDALGMTWNVPDYYFETNYAAAVAWHRQHGDLDVPQSYVNEDGIRLGAWISGIRQRRRTGRLSFSPDQIARLDELGMIWTDRYGMRWEQGFEHARAYAAVNGSLLVPPSWVCPDGFRLGDWVSNQREKYRAGTMKPERRDRLEAIGMVWELPDPWELRFRLAEQYYREHGNLRMPADWTVEGIWLGRWLDEQRLIREGKRKGKQLSPEQIRRLESIGMTWTNRVDAAWEETLEEAKACLKQYGDIPSDAVSRRGYHLRKWLVDNRRKAAKGQLSPERAAGIRALMLPEKGENRWLEAAAAYREAHGDLDVPAKYITPDGRRLGLWIQNTRRDGREKLSREDAERLDALGMIWGNRFDAAWERALRALEEYVSAHGNGKLPFRYTTADGFGLERWLYEQRKAAVKGKLRQDRLEKLERVVPGWQNQYIERAQNP